MGPNDNTVTTALLLIAHGSRHAAANDDLHHLANCLRATGRYTVVATAFLELAEPTIEEAARRCVEHGAERVLLLPYFLSAGVHVQRDLQTYRARLAQQYSQSVFLLAEPLGRHPLLIDIVLERAHEAEQAGS
jgi:sirohydrochlorin ferrochelatase